MASSQTLLFPDPRPLVERLGEDFFRQLPRSPGVYLMQDASAVVLYVGKAKNLHQRLGHYRVANPDRMRRRHLRLLRQVVRIELQECADEPAALAREADLLRTLKPKFNRAGVWQGTPRFLVWRRVDRKLELAIAKAPLSGWQTFGPFGSGIVYLRASLVRLLWYGLNPGAGSTAMPEGWVHGRLGPIAALEADPGETDAVLAKLFEGDTDGFVTWVGKRTKSLVHAYDLEIRDADLENVGSFLLAKARRSFSFALADSNTNDPPNKQDCLLAFPDPEWNQP